MIFLKRIYTTFFYPIIRRKKLKESNQGSKEGWIVWIKGKSIAELDNPDQAQKFWVNYDLTIIITYANLHLNSVLSAVRYLNMGRTKVTIFDSCRQVRNGGSYFVPDDTNFYRHPIFYLHFVPDGTKTKFSN